jgi:uncharacterized repeat protein (TIGR03803 family)
MTNYGGDDGAGTIFKINADGTGFTLLHEFADGSDDGSNPMGSLTLVGSTLYGMTPYGGDDGAGTIFSSAVLGYFLAGRTLRPIQEMLHEQHRFISDASHELRTPLTSLKSAFEVYLRNRKRTKAEADQLVTESIGEVDKLKMLSDSLLSLAHYELPERPLFTTISSKDIVEFAYKRIKNMAEQQHIRFEFPDTAISFQGNFDSVTDLFVILFDNAIKYSPEGSTVSISQEIKDGSVLFSVTDRGIGIAKSDLPHIFDRFYRADAARSRSNMGGYGLGLSIAKKIADMHNGSLRVESIIGKGTTFFVRFPKKHR